MAMLRPPSNDVVPRFGCARIPREHRVRMGMVKKNCHYAVLTVVPNRLVRFQLFHDADIVSEHFISGSKNTHNDGIPLAYVDVEI